jgi:hypothetical protein
MRRTVLAAVVAALTAGHPVSGIYVQPEIRQVPVARLAANLEKQLAASPGDADLHIKLGRLYGMAYAVNSDSVPVASYPHTTTDDIWFGHEPNLVPHRPAPAAPEARSQAAREYLRRSLEHYRAALASDSSSLLARLGHAWTLEQSGEKQAAAAEYRRVIEQAWPKEQTATRARLGSRFFTQEAAEYLIPLLDPERDAAELAELTARATQLRRVPRPITPIAVPLSDRTSPRAIIDLEAQVPFDADGSGQRQNWTWISDDAAWLVYDAAGSGSIGSALQWFGDVTFWLFWKTGYEALRALDDDGSGELTGRELRYLALWRDTDRNGTSDPGEVQPLERYGVAALSCRDEPGDGWLVAARSGRGVRLKDGRVRPTYDVILRPSRSVSAPIPE